MTDYAPPKPWIRPMQTTERTLFPRPVDELRHVNVTEDEVRRWRKLGGILFDVDTMATRSRMGQGSGIPNEMTWTRSLRRVVGSTPNFRRARRGQDHQGEWLDRRPTSDGQSGKLVEGFHRAFRKA